MLIPKGRRDPLDPPAETLRDTARSISREDVERFRRSIEEWNRGDLNATLDFWAADATFDWSNSRGPERGVYRVHAESLAFWQRFLDAFEHLRFELEVVEIGDSLVVENVAFVRGRDGIEAQARSAWLVTMRDGKGTSLILYQTMDEALDAARLRE